MGLAHASPDEAAATEVEAVPRDEVSHVTATIDPVEPIDRLADAHARRSEGTVVEVPQGRRAVGVAETPRRVSADAGAAAPSAQEWQDHGLPSRFEVKGRLGRGGMGLVLEVHDRALDRDVAVKLLPAERQQDRSLRARFLREARAAATLRHEGIVTVHDIDPDGAFIVMELVRGESLQMRLKRVRRLPAAEVRRIGLALAEALAVAHRASVVHRDVKPANILIDEKDRMKLADFGVASFGDSDLTSTGASVGTPAYMAPEQLRGRLSDPRIDVYAAGATLFECATGKRVHAEDASVSDPAAEVLAATGDAALAQAIARALAEKPQDRFASGTELASALRTTTPPVPAPAPMVELRRDRWVPVAVAASLLIMAALGVLASRPSQPGNLASAATPAAEAPRRQVVALLPFDDRSGATRLDFAGAGLPNLLATQLRRTRELEVIGHYRLLERVATEKPSAAELGAIARELGAGWLVSGTLTAGAAANLHLAVTVATIDGRTVSTLERDTRVEDIVATVHAMVGELASLVLGKPTQVDTGVARDLAVERELQLGIAALEQHSIMPAEAHLLAAAQAAPELAEIHYPLAIVSFWRGYPPADVRPHIERARAARLTDGERGFLDGLALLIENRYADALQMFRRLAELHPDDRDILYGLFEALFHGGYPAEAIMTYRRMCELAPRFKLGVIHALMYSISRADREGMAWAIGRADVFGDTESSVWGSRAQMANRDFAGARAMLEKFRTATGAPDLTRIPMLYQTELVMLNALEGDLRTAERIEANNPGTGRLSQLGLETAAGDPRRAAAAWQRLVKVVAAATPQRAVLPQWNDLGTLAIVSGDHAALGEILDRVREIERQDGQDLPPTLPVEIARAFHAGLKGDVATLTALSRSGYPEAAAVAEGLLAERAGQLPQAVAALRRAIAASNDGRYLIAERHTLARALGAAGDHAGVLEACGEVTRPRLFHWSWAAAVAPCLAWSADAAIALGRPDEARAHAALLVSIRHRAGSADPLVLAARRLLPR